MSFYRSYHLRRRQEEPQGQARINGTRPGDVGGITIRKRWMEKHQEESRDDRAEDVRTQTIYATTDDGMGRHGVITDLPTFSMALWQ